MKLHQFLRALLPVKFKTKAPAPQPSGAWPTRTHARKMLMLAGCVQPSMAPNINSATARVLDAAGIEAVIAPAAGCCGAVKFHLNDHDHDHDHDHDGDHDGDKAQMRANVDAWWRYVEGGTVEAIVMNASGCSVTVREYGHILREDPAYAGKAARVSELTRDLSELLPELVPLLKARVGAQPGIVAYHPQCTLQHRQKLRGGVEANLRALGFDVQVAMNEAHLCCGSAGTHSVLQPELAYTLCDCKLGHLNQLKPATMVSANIGGIAHLQSGSEVPVRHWIEILDEAIEVARSRETLAPQAAWDLVASHTSWLIP